MIYCRISLATHGDVVKVKRQEKLCRQLAKRLGWDIVHVYCDNNKSAWRRDRRRPDWDAMLAAVERGEVDAIIVYHGDRLIRQPWDLETLLNLADGRGIRLASPSGTRNLDAADDRRILRIDAANACAEADNISRRARDAHADRAAKGIMRRNRVRTFGYKRSGKIHPGEAEHYRDAVARVLAGESMRSIVRDWNERGVTTTPGNNWTTGAVREVLKNPRHAGLSTYRGEIVGVGRWKALVEREQWEALQAKLGLIGERHSKPGHTSRSKYLLSNVAFHGLCESTVKVHHSSKRSVPSYRCSDSQCSARVTRNMTHVDTYVVGAVLKRLADPRLWAALEARPVDNGAGAELAALEAKRKSAMGRFTRDINMTDAELGAILRDLDAQIEAVRARIASRGNVHVLSGCRDMTRAQWDALPLDRRRAIVRATVTVEILPAKKGRGFDPDSVRVLPVETRVAGDGDGRP